METTALSGIRSNPLFDTLVKRRRTFVAVLTAATLIPYYGFIFAAAFAPHLLAAKLSSGIVNVAWPIGVALIVGAWLLTGLYARRANGEFDELIAKMPLEERVYRLRCVEAWSMTVPWSGFPMRALVDLARPLSGAKYVVTTSFQNLKAAIGQREAWYSWPYVEGLTLAEATNDLAFLATGVYGKPRTYGVTVSYRFGAGYN